MERNADQLRIIQFAEDIVLTDKDDCDCDETNPANLSQSHTLIEATWVTVEYQILAHPFAPRIVIVKKTECIPLPAGQEVCFEVPKVERRDRKRVLFARVSHPDTPAARRAMAAALAKEEMAPAIVVLHADPDAASNVIRAALIAGLIGEGADWADKITVSTGAAIRFGRP